MEILTIQIREEITWMLQIISRRIERVLQENKRNWLSIIYRSAYTQGDQKKVGKYCYGIDYKKADDMVQLTWIIEYLKMYKMSNKIINFFMEAMENWKVELAAGGQTLVEGKIQRSIFQRDSLSPLIFVIVVMPLNYIRRRGTGGYKITRKD